MPVYLLHHQYPGIPNLPSSGMFTIQQWLIQRFEGLVKTSDLLSADAPQQVKEDLKQVDEDLDAIFNHLVC